MAVATGVTLSASLTGIVDDIRVRAHKFMAHKGVMKALVTPVGVGQKGKSVTEPYWDPTSRTGTGATEGQLFTQFSSYVPTTRSYTETEWAEGTILTYDDVDTPAHTVLSTPRRSSRSSPPCSRRSRPTPSPPLLRPA